MSATALWNGTILPGIFCRIVNEVVAMVLLRSLVFAVAYWIMAETAVNSWDEIREASLGVTEFMSMIA